MSVKRETFVSNIGKGMTMTAAYMDAYKVENESYAGKAASRLMKKDEVANAVASLQTRAAKRAEIDVAAILRRLNRIATKAEREKQFAPAIQALTLLGKHLGMWREDPAQINLNLGFAGRAFGDMATEQIEMLVMARLEARR